MQLTRKDLTRKVVKGAYEYDHGPVNGYDYYTADGKLLFVLRKYLGNWEGVSEWNDDVIILHGNTEAQARNEMLDRYNRRDEQEA